MSTTTAKVRVSRDGRIVIPSALRRALGMRAGDELVLEIDGETLLVLTRRARLRQVQTIAARSLAGKPSLADELIAERRAEAAAEDRAAQL